MTKIKRTNIRYMTWICLAVLVGMAFRVYVAGMPDTDTELAKFLAGGFFAVVLGYVGVSVGADTFNAHSARKHDKEK